MSLPEGAGRSLNYAQAILEGTRQEMERDDNVFVMGLGVDDPKGLHGTTIGLNRLFGADRCFDTPIAEDAMTGVAIGAALNGMRPIHVHQRMDFLMLCMNQLVNVAAKQHYMFAGALKVPMVVRASIGRSWGQGAQHSQAFHSFFMHVPGLRVVCPTTAFDAKGALIAAIRDDNPVMVVEHRMLYALKGIVPLEPYASVIGKARILRPGTDLTIVGVSHMLAECLRAANRLEDIGLSVEVIDPIWLAPLDIDTIAASVARTGRLLVVDNGWTNCGASAEIISQVLEWLPGAAPVVGRMGFLPTPCPTTRVLEEAFYPTGRTIALRAARLCGHGQADTWDPGPVPASEVTEFRGPF
ncbi:transketolase C-terminal domain-containing protein [Thalassobaculum sp.]|uniref:alpha-ketoacid dehydrogenase subunit beta n=1 Tax=Thalassobaculum sp. TaxID=2022740 RepID=UPI0032EE650E